MALADYQALVRQLVRDESGTLLQPGDFDQAIELARLRYSQDCPLRLVEDVTWPAAGAFAPTPEGWEQGQSSLVRAEHPVGQVPPSVIDLSVYVQPGGVQQLCVPDPLQAGQVVRVTFARPHQLDGSGVTVPAEHQEALASYAAHILCKQLAAHYSGERDASIGADGSNTESRSRNYALRARDYRASYYAGIGRIDPQADKSGGLPVQAAQPASSIGALPCRGRSGLTRGAVR